MSMARHRLVSPPPESGGRWWWVALGLMVSGVGLGWYGFDALPERRGEDWSTADHAYRAMQLLLVDEGATRYDEGWALSAGRILAPLGAALAAVRGIAHVFRSEI